MHNLAAEGYQLHVLSFDYGQRHKKELQFATLAAQRLDARHDTIDLGTITPFLKGSALTDDISVPEGHYAADNMAITVVPNRNAIMLSVAFAVAVAEQAEIVAAGFHAGDHYIYPDCRPAFAQAFDTMQRLAVEGFGHPQLRLVTPFLNIGKHAIVSIGHRLGVPFAETWSCYKGAEKHCGRCGTCVERKLAFQEALVVDPTDYEDTTYAPRSPIEV
ncbi:MAG: 7-cyano-7-deazaguanine synthase QueC [Chloroflexi bacterium]|nr:7-cyano-7-deazaguanine synthase QueC [Chloroflexota bacterium]